jgi:histidyl-tRNA synthetase
MKSADRSGAGVVVIVGDDEVSAGTIIVRTMENGSQRVVARTEACDAVRAALGH